MHSPSQMQTDNIELIVGPSWGLHMHWSPSLLCCLSIVFPSTVHPVIISQKLSMIDQTHSYYGTLVRKLALLILLPQSYPPQMLPWGDIWVLNNKYSPRRNHGRATASRQTEKTVDTRHWRVDWLRIHSAKEDVTRSSTMEKKDIGVVVCCRQPSSTKVD